MDRIMLPQRPVWLGPRGLWSQLSVLFPGSGARRPEPLHVMPWGICPASLGGCATL